MSISKTLRPSPKMPYHPARAYTVPPDNGPSVNPRLKFIEMQDIARPVFSGGTVSTINAGPITLSLIRDTFARRTNDPHQRRRDALQHPGKNENIQLPAKTKENRPSNQTN